MVVPVHLVNTPIVCEERVELMAIERRDGDVHRFGWRLGMGTMRQVWGHFVAFLLARLCPLVDAEGKPCEHHKTTHSCCNTGNAGCGRGATSAHDLRSNHVGRHSTIRSEADVYASGGQALLGGGGNTLDVLGHDGASVVAGSKVDSGQSSAQDFCSLLERRVKEILDEVAGSSVNSLQRRCDDLVRSVQLAVGERGDPLVHVHTNHKGWIPCPR
mmetsp:Transcript_71153/g.148407  ORF Transcript_71153/g.148407 Transcript_71153/m.148407 type:complete len:215 (-) Transcript_71153:44-688(-)